MSLKSIERYISVLVLSQKTRAEMKLKEEMFIIPRFYRTSFIILLTERYTSWDVSSIESSICKTNTDNNSRTILNYRWYDKIIRIYRYRWIFSWRIPPCSLIQKMSQCEFVVLKRRSSRILSISSNWISRESASPPFVRTGLLVQNKL